VKKQKARRLVIDASVARAAGETNHPISKACRDTLSEILTACHKMVTTKAILAEWEKHRSRFSIKWQASMVAKKKFFRVDDPQNDSLRKIIDSLELNDKEIAAIQKDIHLIEATIATDKTIISCDQALRDILAKAYQNLELLKELLYVNPTKESDEVMEWLRKGAIKEKRWMLSSEIEVKK